MHECPCRLEISHPRYRNFNQGDLSHLRNRNFNQGRGLLSPCVNSDPGVEISLSYIDRLMVDSFSPTFPSFIVET